MGVAQERHVKEEWWFGVGRGLAEQGTNGHKMHIFWRDAWIWMGQDEFGVHSSMTAAAFNDHGYLRKLSRP